MSQLMRLWYLSQRWPAKAQASLCIQAVSPEPSLFAQTKYGCRGRVRPNMRQLAPLDSCACAFEEFTEDEKYHNLRINIMKKYQQKWATARQNQQNDMCAQRRLRSALMSSHSDDADQNGRMPRLIWVIAGHTSFCWLCHAHAQMQILPFACFDRLCTLSLILWWIWEGIQRQWRPRGF